MPGHRTYFTPEVGTFCQATIKIPFELSTDPTQPYKQRPVFIDRITPAGEYDIFFVTCFDNHSINQVFIGREGVRNAYLPISPTLAHTTHFPLRTSVRFPRIPSYICLEKQTVTSDRHLVDWDRSKYFLSIDEHLRFKEIYGIHELYMSRRETRASRLRERRALRRNLGGGGVNTHTPLIGNSEIETSEEKKESTSDEEGWDGKSITVSEPEDDIYKRTLPVVSFSPISRVKDLIVTNELSPVENFLKEVQFYQSHQYK